MLNLKLLEKVRDKVLSEPEKHKQDMWMTVTTAATEPLRGEVSCPTTGCVAGWACQISGDHALIEDDEGRFDKANGTITYEIWNVVTPENRVVDIEYRAQYLLGLSDEDANELFDAENSRDMVLRLLADLIFKAHLEKEKFSSAGV